MESLNWGVAFDEHSQEELELESPRGPILSPIMSTGSLFWCPGSDLYGHQSRLHVYQLGHRPESHIWTLTIY